ncbi:MAG: FAD-dependent oxidoreductase, partial [Ferruginibacter sp.]
MDTILHTDIVIVGGGSAGVAAAVAASRKGSQVILIERNAYPGGKATAAEVGTICGLYKFNKKEDS